MSMRENRTRLEKSDAYSLAELPAGYVWNDQNPAERLALLWAYWPQLQSHAAEIMKRPAMWECSSGCFLNLGPLYCDLDLGGLMQRWCAPEEGNPWLQRSADGRLFHVEYATYGLSGRFFGSRAVSMETGELTKELEIDRMQIKARPPFHGPFRRRRRRGVPWRLPTGLVRPVHNTYIKWLHWSEDPVALAYSIEDPGRRLENPTMKLHEVVSHFLPHPPVVVHVPHLSAHVPLRGYRLLPRMEVARAAEACADWYMDELLPAVPGVVQVLPRVSRLVVDVTRSASDPEVIPTRLPDGRLLRPAEPDNERRDMLAAYHRQHHNLLNLHLDTSLELHDSARLLTLQGVSGEDQPDVCIGFNPSHMAPGLDDILRALCAGHGFSCRVKPLFNGVPQRYRDDPRVVSIYLYIRRDLYLDESTRAKKPEGFRRLQALVLECAKAMHGIDDLRFTIYDLES